MASSHSLVEAMAIANQKLQDFYPIPFYGSLLGCVREGAPIQGDDDVDFLIEASRFKEVASMLSNDPSCEILLEDSDGPFLQFNMKECPNVPIDLYGFYFSEDGTKVSEDWNFNGVLLRPLFTLTFAKKLLFPLRRHEILGLEYWLPREPEELCRRLYGRSWRIPQVKGRTYKSVAVLGKVVIMRGPVLVSFNLIIHLLRKLKVVRLPRKVDNG